jgi:hypothetical protein
VSVVAALGAGLMLCASMPPWGWWPLAITGIALWLWLLGDQPGRARFALSWLVGVAWFAPSTVSLHFKGKEALFIACLEEDVDLLFGKVTSAVKEHPYPLTSGDFSLLLGLSIVLREWTDFEEVHIAAAGVARAIFGYSVIRHQVTRHQRHLFQK